MTIEMLCATITFIGTFLGLNLGRVLGFRSGVKHCTRVLDEIVQQHKKMKDGD